MNVLPPCAWIDSSHQRVNSSRSWRSTRRYPKSILAILGQIRRDDESIIRYNRSIRRKLSLFWSLLWAAFVTLVPETFFFVGGF